jgi:hypothetical protein
VSLGDLRCKSLLLRGITIRNQQVAGSIPAGGSILSAVHAAVSEPLPEWLTETPLPAEYQLVMSEGGIDCQECQSISITRNEFLLVKVFLAKLRGFRVPLEKPEEVQRTINALPFLWEELDPEEIAAVTEAAHA